MSDRDTLLLLVGAPGSGKGTLSQRCVTHLGFQQLSTGDLCRQHIAQQSEIGTQIQKAIDAGKLVDDTLIGSMVSQWLVQQKVGQQLKIILDGFPRTVAQARFFDGFLKVSLADAGIQVVRLLVDHEIVIKRVGSRVICSNKKCQAVYSSDFRSVHAPRIAGICDVCHAPLNKRSDDQEATIRERLKTYDIHERELLDFYGRLGYQLMELDAHRDADEIFNDFVLRLETV